jgi:hypothetical protein
MDDREVRRRVGVVEERLAALEELAEPQRSVALDAVRELVELYGESLARLLRHARAAGADGLFDGALAGDELVAHMLLLHGLHPEGDSARIEAALAALRPQLASRSATVELESVEGDAARLRFAAARPLPEDLVEIFEQAVLAAAPELARVESVGAVAEEGFVPLGALRRKGGAA